MWLVGIGAWREQRNPLKTWNSYEFNCFKRIKFRKVLHSKKQKQN